MRSGTRALTIAAAVLGFVLPFGVLGTAHALSGQYCAGPGGEQVFVADGAPVPSGFTCPSPGPSAPLVGTGESGSVTVGPAIAVSAGSTGGGAATTTGAPAGGTASTASSGTGASMTPVVGSSGSSGTSTGGAVTTPLSTANSFVSGRYCRDASGGQVFVASGAPSPSNVSC